MKTKIFKLLGLGILGGIIGFLITTYLIVPQNAVKYEVKDVSDKSVILINLSDNKKIPLDEFGKVLYNSFSSEYGLYKKLDIKPKSQINLLCYTTPGHELPKLTDFLNLLETKNHVVILDKINNDARPSNKLISCCPNQGNIRTLFDNNGEKLTIFIEPADKGEFMQNIFEVLNELHCYEDVFLFFDKVQRGCKSEIYFSFNDTTKNLSEIDTLRNQKLNDFSKDLEQIFKNKSEKKRNDLIRVMEAKYSECTIEYSECEDYDDSETYSIAKFVEYYFNDLAPGNKTFTNPIPQQDKCKYNITYDELKKFVIQTGCLNEP